MEKATKSKLEMAKSKSTTRGRSMPRHWKGKEPPVLTAAYDNLRWHEAQRDLNELYLEENAMFLDKRRRPMSPKPITDRRKAFNLLMGRYVRYTRIIRNLDECYMYMVHPQKRFLLKQCIEGALVRLLEIKDYLMDIDQREFHFFEDYIQDFNLTPDDVELKIPEYYQEHKAMRFLPHRNDVMFSSAVGISINVSDASLVDLPKIEEETTLSRPDTMSVKEAVLLIQRMERAYIGRRKFNYIKRASLPVERKRELMRWAYNKWICFNKRRKVDRIRKEYHMELDMEHKPAKFDIDLLTTNHIRRNKQKAIENALDFEEDVAFNEEYLLENEGPEMARALKYNIVQWIIEMINLTGKVPQFPTEEKGGSNLLFSQKTVEQVEWDLKEMEEEENKKKGKGKGKGKDKKKKKKKKKEKKEKKDKKGKKKKGEPEEYEWVMPKTDTLPRIGTLREKYQRYWYFKDDAGNIDQTHDKDYVQEEIRLSVSEKIRVEVDELIRYELEQMEIGIDHVKKKRKKGKKGKKGKKKGKKGRKGRKGKKGKDLTKDRTMEDLVKELVDNGIVKDPESYKLTDFIGDYSYTGCIMQDSGINPMPALADIRRLVTEMAILPLGSERIHQMAPLNRSLLLAGVRGTGKNLLVNAICHETGAVLFDLTPANVHAHYGTKKGKKMLMHLIMKVGKALQPAVFWVDNCEKMFLKKKDKKDKTKPHTWAKILPKTIKKIKKGDRMLLIGTATFPNLSKPKRMNRCFKRTIPIPPPDYASRYKAWRHFITTISRETDLNLDFSSLTKVTSGFSMKAIEQACKMTLNEARLYSLRAKGRQLKTVEFVQEIAKLDPIYKDEYASFQNWYIKTPLSKKRLKRLAEEEEGADGGKGGKKGDKGKKGEKGGKKKGKGKKGGKKKK